MGIRDVRCMKAISLMRYLSLSGTKFNHMYGFDCGNTMFVYDVTTMYGLDQIIAHAIFLTKNTARLCIVINLSCKSSIIYNLIAVMAMNQRNDWKTERNDRTEKPEDSICYRKDTG